MRKDQESKHIYSSILFIDQSFIKIITLFLTKKKTLSLKTHAMNTSNFEQIF
jgi:hypothetical protein